MTKTDSFHFDFSDAGADAAVPTEEVTLNYEKVEWTYQKFDQIEWTYSAADRIEWTYSDPDKVKWTYSEFDHLEL